MIKKFCNARLLMVLSLLFIMLSSCGRQKRADHDPGATAYRVVRVMHPIQRFFGHSAEYTGTVKPWREANLGSSLPGRVEKIYFAEGDFAKQGQLVARLSAEPEIMARVERDTWENDYNRVKRLRERGSVTQQELDHVEAQYKAAKAKHELILKNTEIRAPFDGVVTEILVNEGESFFFLPALDVGVSFSPGIVRLMQLSPLLVSFQVSEKEISQLRNAQTITITADALPGKTFSATLHKTAPMVSLPGRTLSAQVRIDDPGSELLVGMFARVNIQQKGDDHLFLPAHAVLQQQESYFVWIVDENEMAVKMPVVPVFTHQGEVAVSGITKDVRVIVAGSSALEEGMQVNFEF